MAERCATPTIAPGPLRDRPPLNRRRSHRHAPVPLLLLLLLALIALPSNAQPVIEEVDAGETNVAAWIDGEIVLDTELVSKDLATYYDLLQKLYDFKKKMLYRRILDHYLQKNPGALPASPDEISVSDSDIDAFIRKQAPKNASISPRLRKRIHNYLKRLKYFKLRDAFLERVTSETPVRVFFRKPNLRYPVTEGPSPVLGPETAPLTIITFSDFQCPYCRRWKTTMDSAMAEYGDSLRFIFRQHPLDNHPLAETAALYALCLAQQNSDYFWFFHDVVFTYKEALTEKVLRQIVVKSGADMEEFARCLGSDAVRDRLRQDQEAAEKLGARRTPTSYLNGRLIPGAIPYAQLREMIEEELR
ncbi:MAG: DsbA family protein [Candidatus Hydrogenedentota bacterium]|nr:MAG: DsbA family protein [Candidatus Hydrogenedentota bacterium]